MANTSVGIFKVDLANYEAIHEGLVSKEFIDWGQLPNWSTRNPKTLGVEWFAKCLKAMTDLLEELLKETNRTIAERGGSSELVRIDYLEDITDAARALLMGIFPDEFVAFMTACMDWDVWLPSTIPSATKSMEPCGPPIVSPCNLGPEWIRHFIGVLYKKALFTGSVENGGTGQQYFPFENRDHLIHSALVLLMGEVLQRVPIDNAAKIAVAKILGDNPADYPDDMILKDLMVTVYRKHHLKAVPQGVSPEIWLSRIWPVVALWHDSGYDATTWQLLTFREFSHSFALRTKINRLDISVEIFARLKGILDDDLAKLVKPVLDGYQGVQTGYDRIWYTEGCQIQNENKRPWGRFHALLSAFELSELISYDSKVASVVEHTKHLSTAVALHHEQMLIDEIEKRDINDSQLAEVFVKNPILSLLQFADVMSGFARGKVKEIEKTQIDEASINEAEEQMPRNASEGYLDQIGLEVDWSDEPVCIWLPDGKTRPCFYRGKEQNIKPEKTKIRLRALWGDFIGDVSDGEDSDWCPRTYCRMGLLPK